VTNTSSPPKYIEKEKSSVSDPYFRLNTNPDPIQIQAFDDQKLRKKITAEIFFHFLGIKTTIYLSLGPTKLQTKPSALKREHPAPAKYEFSSYFPTFVGHFCPD
jgi:hypothetical protein